MNIMELGAIGELVGGVAVIASLIFVGLQVRQNTFQVRSQTASSMTREIFEAFDPVYAHHEVFFRGMEGDPELGSRDQELVMYLLSRVFAAVQDTFYQTQHGALDPMWLRIQGRVLQRMLASNGGRKHWHDQKALLEPDFQRFVDELLMSVEQPDTQTFLGDSIA